MSDYLVDGQTGEVLTQRGLQVYEPQDNEIIATTDPTVASLLSGKTPYHIQRLKDKRLSADEEEYQMSLFTGGAPVPFDAYINKEVTILGAAVIPHPPYRAKGDPVDAPLRPGYLKMRFVIDKMDEDGNPVILETSGTEVFSHMVNAINSYGWYLWDHPRKYLITKGGKNGAFFMRNMEKRYTPVQKAQNK